MPLRPNALATPAGDELYRYINLKLAALGQPTSRSTADPKVLEIAAPLLRNYYQKDELLGPRLCPVDTRIQAFLDDYLSDVRANGAPRLPARTFVLDRPGLGRVMSLPATQDSFSSPYLKSYRVPQGVLHNPKADRRTTQGIFHIVEGGYPVSADKIAVPKRAFASLLEMALHPPAGLLTLPFTADQDDRAELFVSLLLRPLVCPQTAASSAKTMETRFFAPGSLVSNLDFVESIFGNGGDPYLPENDSALDIDHWTGHTGCVILAPHIVGRRKTELGLPHYDDATPRQRRDGMCWQNEDEIYNNGNGFKLVCRDHRGVMVTIIADNYYGYCKKEVKTQISFAANLYGACEEEHAGGAMAFPAYVLGRLFYAGRTVLTKQVSFEEAMRWIGDRADIHQERYAVDRNYPDVIYVPENSEFSVAHGIVRWDLPGGGEHKLTLKPHEVYVLPWGTKIRLQKQMFGGTWRLIASRAEPTLCHKPCTVSGGGKSEISKSLYPLMSGGPVFVSDFDWEIEQVAQILDRDFSNIFRNPRHDARARRPILSEERSLGSVIKLMTPSPEYTHEHNSWIESVPQTVRQLLIIVKRYYQPEWGENWRQYFSVDRINGQLGNELKFESGKLIGKYLRVGYDPNGAWRIHRLRPDFNPAHKIQVEDDITASITLPADPANPLDRDVLGRSIKLVRNCESHLFQRPDDAIHRGMDREAESDLATPGTFLSNFEPLTLEQAREIVEHVVEFDKYTEPTKRLLRDFVDNQPTEFVVASSHPRMVGGSPSKNPRYLQRRPDLVHPREAYLAEIGTRLSHEVPADQAVFVPVHAVLAGRRNNPPDPKLGIPPLAVYNPIHYQELPELFMDYICSLTGKSPSTTGFGSEGALTKGPFNALLPVIDLNNALVSAILTGNDGFTTAAGYIGPHYRVDHDNSMLVPEVWCRMRFNERDPRFLIDNGFFEKVEDFDHKGRTVRASRLGYRMTSRFVDRFLGRIFEAPGPVFTEELLRPEKQDLDMFVAGIEAIVEAQRTVALNYFEDGSIADACPPIAAVLHVMAYGEYKGMRIDDPELRKMFTREALLQSDWYRDRLMAKQTLDVALWRRHIRALEHQEASGLPCSTDLAESAKGADERRHSIRESAASWGRALDTATVLRALPERMELARRQFVSVSRPEYIQELSGTIGADPSVLRTAGSDKRARTRDLAYQY